MVKKTQRGTETAAQAYAERAAKIDAQITTLVAKLAKHRQSHEADPRNWGFVGDLGHVQELLDQVNVFLGVEADDNVLGR